MMKCFNCNHEGLVLAPLWPHQREEFSNMPIVLRMCPNCGFHQNKVGAGEPLTVSEAIKLAPDKVEYAALNLDSLA